MFGTTRVVGMFLVHFLVMNFVAIHNNNDGSGSSSLLFASGDIMVDVVGPVSGWSNWTFCGSCRFTGVTTMGGSNERGKAHVADMWKSPGWRFDEVYAYAPDDNSGTVSVVLTNKWIATSADETIQKAGIMSMMELGSPRSYTGNYGEFGFGTDYFGHMAAQEGWVMYIEGTSEFSVDATFLHPWTSILNGCKLILRVNDPDKLCEYQI